MLESAALAAVSPAKASPRTSSVAITMGRDNTTAPAPTPPTTRSAWRRIRAEDRRQAEIAKITTTAVAASVGRP